MAVIQRGTSCLDAEHQTLLVMPTCVCEPFIETLMTPHGNTHTHGMMGNVLYLCLHLFSCSLSSSSRSGVCGRLNMRDATLVPCCLLVRSLLQMWNQLQVNFSRGAALTRLSNAGMKCKYFLSVLYFKMLQLLQQPLNAAAAAPECSSSGKQMFN